MYRLLERFEALFGGTRYNHRNSTLGDSVAVELYEDLLTLDPTSRLVQRMTAGTRVVNARNLRRGVTARRGDGTLGELIPNTPPVVAPGYAVARGEVATVEIGVEVKILAKAMLKQIDRVVGDLTKQVAEFQRGGGNPVTLGIVGLNHAGTYTSYEGSRSYTTTGRGGYLHPAQEAPTARTRLEQLARPSFDQFLVLPFVAENTPPYDFAWLNQAGTEIEYGAVLTRVLRTYEQRYA